MMEEPLHLPHHAFLPEAALLEAVDALQRGHLVAFPTETVYGLGADARNEEAVRRIFRAKGRPADHPLIVHLASAEQVTAWAREVPEVVYALAEHFWPGPLTLILKRRAGVPDVVTGAQDTVGLRVPGHPVAQRLLTAFGGGVAAPSANRFGRISPTTAQHVEAELGGRVEMILDGGPCDVGLESTILDLSALGAPGGALRLLRPGGVEVEALQAVLRETELKAQDLKIRDLKIQTAVSPLRVPRVSGSLESHYAPNTPATLVADAEAYLRVHPEFAETEVAGAGDASKGVAVLAQRPQPTSGAAQVPVVHWKELPDAPVDYGRHLYAALRELDALGCAGILVEAPPATSAWAAVADRLRRATAPAERPLE